MLEEENRVGIAKDLTSLPKEIWLMIVRCLCVRKLRLRGPGHDTATLKALRLVNSTLNEFATPALFQVITIAGPRDKAVQRMNSLAGSQLLCHLVYLVLPLETILDQDECAMFAQDGRLANVSAEKMEAWRELKLPLGNFLNACPEVINIASLGQPMMQKHRVQARLNLQPYRSFYQVIAGALHHRPSLKIKKCGLRLNRLGVANSLWTRSDQLLGKVEELSIEQKCLSTDEIAAAEDRAKDEFDKFISCFLLSAPHLTHLSLINEGGTGKRPGIHLSNIAIFPNIIRRNLTTLKLHHCLIDGNSLFGLFQDLTNLECVVLKFLSFPRHRSLYRWKDIFALMTTGLLRLLTVEFACLKHHEDHGAWRHQKGMGLDLANNPDGEPFRPLDSKDQEDYDALETLIKRLLRSNLEEGWMDYLTLYLAPHILRPRKLQDVPEV